MQNFMKIRPMGSELLHAEERTDCKHEVFSHFSQFCQIALLGNLTELLSFIQWRTNKPCFRPQRVLSTVQINYTHADMDS
jgi:hypothetical protein